MSQATPQQQVVAKCKEVFTKAQQLYGLDLSQVAIHFDLKGRAAGMARPPGRRSRTSPCAQTTRARCSGSSWTRRGAP